MANNSFLGANVDFTAGGSSWLDLIILTNQLAYDMGTVVVTVSANSAGGQTTGNAHVTGTLSATTLVAGTGLRGGTVETPAALTISTNTAISGTLTTTGTVSTDTVNVGNNTIEVTSGDLILKPGANSEIDASGARIINVGTPTANTDAVTPEYLLNTYSILDKSINSANNKFLFSTGPQTWELGDISVSGRSLLAANNTAAMQAVLSLVPGTNVMGFSTQLNSIAGTTFQTGDLLYVSGANTFTRLPKGTAGKVLKQGASIPEWGDQAWEKLSEFTANNDATIEIFLDTTKYRMFQVFLEEIYPDTDAVTLQGRLKSANTVVTSSNYSYVSNGTSLSSRVSNGAKAAAFFTVSNADSAWRIGNVGAEEKGFTGVLTLIGFQNSNSYSTVMVQGMYHQYTSVYVTVNGHGQLDINGIHNGIQLYMSSGNIVSGRVTVTGLRI